MSATFPPIPATNDQPSRVLSYNTIVYIHFLGQHCMSYHLAEMAKGFSKDFGIFGGRTGGNGWVVQDLAAAVNRRLHHYQGHWEGASGDQGDRRLSGKRKPESTVFNMDVAAPDTPPLPWRCCSECCWGRQRSCSACGKRHSYCGRRGGLGCRRLLHQPLVARPRAAAVGTSANRKKGVLDQAGLRPTRALCRLNFRQGLSLDKSRLLRFSPHLLAPGLSRLILCWDDMG